MSKGMMDEAMPGIQATSLSDLIPNLQSLNDSSSAPSAVPQYSTALATHLLNHKIILRLLASYIMCPFLKEKKKPFRPVGVFKGNCFRLVFLYCRLLFFHLPLQQQPAFMTGVKTIFVTKYGECLFLEEGKRIGCKMFLQCFIINNFL